MPDPTLISPAARRDIRTYLRSLSPSLIRRFREILRGHPYDPVQTRALIALTPIAASQKRTLEGFLEQVEYNGRRLSKSNLPLPEVIQRLSDLSAVLPADPAREQLHLLTTLVLNQAYFAVRESEAQAFFGLYHAESQATSLENLLERLIRVLVRSFGALTGRIVLDPPLGKLARPLYSTGGGRSRWSFPVRDAALIELEFPKPYPWLPRELTLLQAIAERCHDAIERARIHRELRRLEATARTAEEEERRRIGRELHDEAAQSLILLRLQLEMMQRDAPAALHPRLDQTRVIAERTIEELRRTIAALSPAKLERLGLERALHQLAERLRKDIPAQVRVCIPESCGEVARPAQEVVYRVAQESLNNIRKHSQASRIKLLLDSTDKSIRLSVRDNGTGFDAEAALAKPMSFGLAGMRERAALLGGTLHVHSAPGKGSTVTLELPRAC
jgi:signal transduction histidine kinase